jgi:hypothetical protein
VEVASRDWLVLPSVLLLRRVVATSSCFLSLYYSYLLSIHSSLALSGKDPLMLSPDEEDEISIADLAFTVADCMGQ